MIFLLKRFLELLRLKSVTLDKSCLTMVKKQISLPLLKFKGDVGKKFYIIVEGSVYILPPTEETLLAEHESKLDPKKKTMIKTTKKLDLERKRAELSNFLTDAIPEELKISKIQEAYPGFFVLKSIGQGEGFGELAFQGNGERKRAATIICRQKTLLGCLSYEDFQSILSIKKRTI